MNWNKLAPKVKFSTLKGGAELKESFSEFSVWDWGTGRYGEILGGMETDIDKGRIIVADYEYEYSRQKHAPANVGGMRRGLTFCILKHEGLDLPEIFLRNEAPVQKVFRRAIGKHDIYFAEDPEFSDRFEVQGPELEIHQLFRPEIRSYFLRYFEYSPLRMEVKGDGILLHFGMMIQPEDCRMLIYSAVNIANFWMDGIVKYEIPPEVFFKGQL